jgi:hypothetical protein
MISKRKIVLTILLLFLVLPSSLHLPVHILVAYAQGGEHSYASLKPLLDAIQDVYNTLASLGVAEISFEPASDTVWKTTYTITKQQIIRAFGSDTEVKNRVKALVNTLIDAFSSGSSSDVASRLGAVLMIYKDRVIQDFPDLAGINNGPDLWNAILQKFGGSVIKAKNYVSSIATEQISNEILNVASHTRTYDGVIRWITDSGVEYRILVEWKSAYDISETKNLLYSIREAILDSAIVKTYSDARLTWIVYNYPPHQSELFRLLRTSGIGAFQNDMWLQETLFGYGEGMGLYEIIRAYTKSSNPEQIYSSVKEFVPSVKRAYMLVEQGKARLRFRFTEIDYIAFASIGAELIASSWEPKNTYEAQIQQFLFKFADATHITIDALLTASGLGELFLAAIGEEESLATIGAGGSFAGGVLTLAILAFFFTLDYLTASQEFEDLYNQVLSGANSPRIYRLSKTIYNGVTVQLVAVQTSKITLPRYLFIFVNNHLVKIASVHRFSYRFKAEDFGASFDALGVHITLGRGRNYDTDAVYIDYRFVTTTRSYFGRCFRDIRYLYTYTWAVDVADVFYLRNPPVTSSVMYLGSGNLICPSQPVTQNNPQPTGGGMPKPVTGVSSQEKYYIIRIFGINITLPCYVDIFGNQIKMPYCKD